MKKNNSFFKLAVKVLSYPFYLVGVLIPKNDKIWVFGSVSGNKFCDNSKYLYEFVSKKQGYKAVWLTKNSKIINYLNRNNKICYHFYSIKGIYYALIARYVILSYSYDDVSFACYLFPQKSKIIQLFHGTPLKKLDFKRKLSALNALIRFTLLFYIGRNYDLIISTSDLSAEALNRYFKMEKEKYLITGYPRNDILFKKNEDTFLTELKSKKKFSRVILYLPTFRDYSDKNKDFNLFDRYNFDKEKLEIVLEKYDAIMLVKLHFVDYEKAKKTIGNLQDSEKIYFIREDDINDDIYPILAHADVLITDYSSIYFDFLLLDRPIIFSAFDIDEYRKRDRGFYFDYENVTPGPRVNNWDNLCSKLEDAFECPEKYAQERIKTGIKFNKFIDSESSQRVFNALIAKE